MRRWADLESQRVQDYEVGIFRIFGESPLPVAGLLAVMILLPSVGESAFRCGTGLVDVGDWPVEVKEHCGEPDYIAIYPQATLPGIGLVLTVEHWYYNPGPGGFIRRLIFRNGRLQSQDTQGYGFLPGAAGDCNPRALRHGMSEFEVVGRCGEPLSRRITWVAPEEYTRDSSGRSSSLQVVYPLEEWMYEFGRNQFRRIVTFSNGRIIEIKTADKPH